MLRLVPVSLLTLAACAAPTEGYSLVFLRTGDATELTEEELGAAMRGHFENMGRLVEEGRLLVAGPLGEPRSDPAHRGIFILDTADPVEAVAWAATDPAVQAGVFVLEAFALRSADPLRQIPALDRAAQVRREADPDLPDAWVGRAYVLVRGTPNREAADALEGLGVAVLFRGTLEVERPRGFPAARTGILFGALDVRTPGEAEALLPAGPRWVLHPWYATAVLPELRQ